MIFNLFSLTLIKVNNNQIPILIFRAIFGLPKVAAELKKFPEELDIRYFYNLCGSQDSIAYASASAAAKKMPAESRLSEANWCWQERPGDHNFDIWNLGLYNFLKLLGSMQE